MRYMYTDFALSAAVEARERKFERRAERARREGGILQ